MKRMIVVLLAIMITVPLLEGCGSSAAAGGGDGGRDKELNIFNWSEYLPQSVLDAYKEKTGVDVKIATYASNEEMLAKMMAGGADQYDLVVPSNYVIQAMIRQKLLQPLDKANIPNIKNITPDLLDMDYDKGNTYAVPYMVSFTLIAVNKKTCPVEIKSYNDLLDPRLKDSMVVVDDPRELIGIAMQALGYKFNDTDPAKLAEAKQWLLKLTPNIKAYDGDSPKTKMISGETSVGFIWNGEAALSMKENPDIVIAWPREGVNMAIDNFTVTSGAKHKKAAEDFVNYILEPEVSKLISDEYPYTNPNAAAAPLLGKEYLDCPASNVPAEQVKKAVLTQDAGDAAAEFDKIWSEIKSAQ